MWMKLFESFFSDSRFPTYCMHDQWILINRWIMCMCGKVLFYCQPNSFCGKRRFPLTSPRRACPSSLFYLRPWRYTRWCLLYFLIVAFVRIPLHYTYSIYIRTYIHTYIHTYPYTFVHTYTSAVFLFPRQCVHFTAVTWLHEIQILLLGFGERQPSPFPRELISHFRSLGIFVEAMSSGFVHYYAIRTYIHTLR